jgi:hypothetical protein
MRQVTAQAPMHIAGAANSEPNIHSTGYKRKNIPETAVTIQPIWCKVVEYQQKKVDGICAYG